jgi:tetratricopeptide (TPR) repeat protein
MSRVSQGISFAIIALVVAAVAVVVYFTTVEKDREIDQPPVSIDTGVELFKQKKYREAAELFERVQPGHPQEWYSLYYLGSSYIMLKNFQAAAEHLEQARSLNPTNTKIMHALGVAYFKLGNLKLSKAYFAAVLEFEPDNAEAKGLMDIMAKLERQQPGASQDEAAGRIE